MIVKILLINVVDAEKLVPNYPIGIYTLKSFLNKKFSNECEVKIIDLFFEEVKDVIDNIYKWSPHIVGLSVKTENSHILYDFMENIELLPQNKLSPLIVIGRQVATFGYKELLKKFPKIICVRGEGELAIGGLVEYVNGDKKILDINNLAFIDKENGRIIKTKRSLLPSFDSIGLVDHSETKKYVNYNGNVWIESSRGCPWNHCTFCSITEFWGKPYKRRTKQIKTILEELKQISSFGIERFTFSDEEFIGYGIEGIERARLIAETIIKENIFISFHTDVRAASIWNKNDTQEEKKLRIVMLQKMKQAGLKTIFCGMESGSPSQLKRFNKGADVETYEQAIRICRKLDINMAIGFIMLDPLVSKQEIIESILFIKRNKILPQLSVPLNKMRIYSGSPYLHIINTEEEKICKKLVSDSLDINTLIYETFDYKYLSVKIIVDLITIYTDSEYDFYNALRWFERFNPNIFGNIYRNEYSYLKNAAEESKEYQIEVLLQLAKMTDTELIQLQKPHLLLIKAIEKRSRFISELKVSIINKSHERACSDILYQINNYFENSSISVNDLPNYYS